MDKKKLYREDGYQKGFEEAKRTGGKVKKNYIDNCIKNETRNLPSIYSMEFMRGWYEGFTDGVREVLSKLIQKDDFWGNHVYEVVENIY